MEPSLNAPEIALLSSNARAKYFDDCLRALMLPRGMVLHFRYRDNYFDAGLLTDVGSRAIIGKRVVVCYLLQTPDEKGVPRPQRIRPIRSGVIVEAQRVGPSIHLYFAVDGYPVGGDADGAIANAVMLSARSESKMLFAATVNGLRSDQFSSLDQDASAFAEIVEAFEQADLQMSAEFGGKLSDRDPFFLRVNGLYQRGKNGAIPLSPERIAEISDRQRAYIITSDDPLELRVQFHQPSWSKVDGLGISLDLATDAKHFANPETDRLEIASLYDQAEFYLLPARDEVGWVSRILLTPQFQPAKDAGNIRHIAVPFEALVWAKPVLPRWLVIVSGATANLASVAIAIIAVILSILKSDSTTTSGQTSAGATNVFSAIIGALILLVVLVLVSSVAKVIGLRRR